jgi:hypothetical protein
MIPLISSQPCTPQNSIGRLSLVCHARCQLLCLPVNNLAIVSAVVLQECTLDCYKLSTTHFRQICAFFLGGGGVSHTCGARDH